ncbi:MAG: EAL domain-containing protein [Acidobacteriota bacterium]|nr:EAL domain-containing protein [Acidobacteriota bacterium]
MAKPYRVLIADAALRDDKDLLELMENGGFQLDFANHRDMVLSLLRDFEFDLLVLDMSLDSENDATFLNQIRLLHPREKLPILVCTHGDRPSSAVLALEKGANDVLFYESDPRLKMARLRSLMIDVRHVEDISKRESRYQLAAIGTRDGLFDWDMITNQVFFSEGWKLMLGIPIVDNPETPEDWFARVHEDDLRLLKSRLALHMEGVTPHFECQCRMRHEEGHEIWVLARGVCDRDLDDQAIRLVGSITDLTDRSLHDRRTGLPYRDFFMQRLDQAMAEVQLKEEVRYAVLHVDIDRFKVISEGFGYDIVDKLLISIARRIERCLGKGDTLAFLGGDSFVLLLLDSPGLKNASLVANQIHMQLIAPFQISDNEVFAKASIGIAEVSRETLNREKILRQAQTAMKFARQLGSGHTEVFGEGMASKGRELIQIETALRSALDREEFELHYQPQVQLRSNRIVGFEALLRWRRADGSMVSPGKFIPIAEETDLILTIGEWVLRTACQQSVAWQRMGLPPLRVGVNLSERQFRARNLVGLVRQVLRETGLQPHLLELEITESIFMDDTEEALRILKDFRKLGIKIALDDFGTGYSSLNYLKRIPFTTLKIDKAFIDDLTTDFGDAAICSTIIDLGHKFKMDVIAEGVETKEQLMILRAFLCDEIQGYFFSKPLTAEAFEKLFREQRNK